MYTIDIPILKILQHESTLIGGIAIAWVIYQLPITATTCKSNSFTYWTIVTGVTVTIIALRLFSGLPINQYGHIIVKGISAVLISLVATSWIFKRVTIYK